MTKPKKPAAEAAPEQRKRPPHGGSFIRDPETGELECIERTMAPGGTGEEPASELETGDVGDEQESEDGSTQTAPQGSAPGGANPNQEV